MPTPRLLVILCAPRSFSSVIGAMLGQHPQAYGMPELNMFFADQVDELVGLHRRQRPEALSGLLRALAELHDGEQTEASVQAAERWLKIHGDWSTDRLLHHLIELAGPRLIIDKSPRTSARRDALHRILRMAPDALFLHLTRHPITMGESLLKIVARGRDEWNSPFDPTQIQPQQLWTHINGIARDFLSELPESRVLQVRGENIMAEPQSYLAQIAEWLELDAGESAITAMMHPENSPYSHLGPPNARYGNDPNFLENPVFRPSGTRHPLPPVASPLPWAPNQYLQPKTVKLAREFGYR